MSLIQEALKRQQQEFGGGKTPEASPVVNAEPPVTETMPVMDTPLSTAETQAPALPPPVFPPPPPVSPRSFRPGLKISGIVATGLVILVVGGFMAAKWTLKMVRKTAIPVLAAQPMTVSPGSVMPPANGKDSENSAPQTASGPKPPVSIPALPPARSSQISVSSEPQVSDTVGRTDVLPREKAPLEKAPTVPLQWPTLKLTGILASLSAGEGSACINNQIISIGGQIEDVTLVEIRSDGVLLKYGGETKFLKMGGILY
ncbi:MAG: hypothetical protein L6455_09650 [Kiritimatiellae bacterium]|nr:hypothetical protein [Verrucomicrobiota bacterium]MBU4289619.1 hypothetical protein [Verrucomicrobiota bacterium]MCG2680213.1 hypothetical protein [Kiritimatiellia bacterium]